MKKTLLLSSLLLTSTAFADIDYSRCQGAGMLGMVTIDNDGKLQTFNKAPFKSIKTEGNKETYEMANVYGGGSSFITLERDQAGAITKIINGQDKPDAKYIQNYKEMMINSSVMSIPTNPMSPDVMLFEPSFFVEGKMVKLSKITKEEAKKVGFGVNVEEIQKLKSQWKKDKKSVKKLKESYAAILDKTALSVPAGSVTEVEVKDGVCVPTKISNRTYNAKTKEVITTPSMSKDQCDKIQAVYTKHKEKLDSCDKSQMEASTEMFKELYGEGGMVAGVVGGYVAGQGSGYAGGMAGGYLVGGIASGFGGGYMSMSGMGMYGGMFGSLASQNMTCAMMFGANSQAPATNETPNAETSVSRQ